ncbi:MAG: diaminopimelate decarboxylase [Chloroflexota bacterium]|nr:diaminopimelate decarboxylase [Chloroflexota bacterium]
MSEKRIPLTKQQIEQITQKYPTPFHIYDERAIRENARALQLAFRWNKGFREYFAVKATPNPYLVKILESEGFGVDCSSLPELVLAERIGLSGDRIMFTSNNTPAEEFYKAKELGAIINLDDITHLTFLEKCDGLPDTLCLRYNPGPLKKGNLIIGHPEEAKYGFTEAQLLEGYRIARDKGVKRFGLHTMVASNELCMSYFIDTADIMFNVAVEVYRQLGVRLSFINLGGGIGIPYTLEQNAVDLVGLAEGIQVKYNTILKGSGLAPIDIYLECGRLITGPYGYLVSRVRHIKKTYKNFAGIDACMANLMRPAMYGAYHHITVLDKEDSERSIVYDVTGSLCENNDKMAIDRCLPELQVGDLIVIHDTGAHGHAMGFNYNGKLRSTELLLRENGEVEVIRRAETIDDYFATLDFNKLANFSV